MRTTEAHLQIINGLLSTRLIRGRHSGTVYRILDLFDTPCGLILRCKAEDGTLTTIPWCMRGNYDAMPEGGA